MTGDFQILDGLGRAGTCCPCFPWVARPVGPVKSVPSWVRTKSWRSRYDPKASVSVLVLVLVPIDRPALRQIDRR